MCDPFWWPPDQIITPLNSSILPNVCDPFWMGDIITPLDLPKLWQKYPNAQTWFQCLIIVTHFSGDTIAPLNSPKLQQQSPNSQAWFHCPIIVTNFSGQHNYPTQLTNIAQCLWSILDGWYNYPSWFTKIGAEISKHPNPILVPDHCDPL